VNLRLLVLSPSDLLTDYKPHGDGLVAFGFIRELAARGHQLDVAAQRVDLAESLPSNVRLHILSGGESAGLAARLAFMREIRRLYRRLQRSTSFDVVHQLNPVEVGISLALADAAVPVVLGPYVPDWPRAPTPAGALVGGVKRALRAAQQRRAATVLLSTPAAASKLALGASAHPRVRELTPGIDERRWAPGRGGRGQDVLVLANLEARKGVTVAVEAFARLGSDLPEARLIVAGAGPEAPAIRRLAARVVGDERVRFLGALAHERVKDVMQACDVFCLPSFGEPFGMTVLEAMACARPVVATDAGGPRYLVSQAGGRRVRPGDPGALAAALRELLLDAELRRSMGEHNRRLVEERYAWRPVVDRLEDFYREVRRNS
jgi:glycosyltransferase involved in cell wall biosynthesis